MNRRQIVACLCSLFLMTWPALARAQDAVQLLEDFAGEWTSTDPAFGAPAQSTMAWSPALDGKFARLNYRIEMQQGSGATSVFEGVAYYRSAPGETLTAFWADNSGDLHPIVAVRDGQALVSDWGVAGKKKGRTRYELVETDQMEVTDWVKTDEGWRQFNHNNFKRQDASAQ